MQNSLSKKPWCIAPWVTSYDEFNGDINPCCEWQGDPLIPNPERKNITYQERFSHPNVEKLKHNFKQKILTPDVVSERMHGCKNCMVLEMQGGESLRQQFDHMYAKNNQKFNDWYDENKFTLKYVDYRESNLCNMSCKMCGSSLSSTHAQILGLYTDTKGVVHNPHSSEDVFNNLEHVEEVAFLGGEPLLTRYFYDTCQRLIDLGISKNIVISIVTNGTTLSSKLNEDVLDMLSHFKSVSVAVSIDVIEDQHNYWRHNNTWDKVYENTLKFNEYAMTNDVFRELRIRCAIGWPTAYASRKVFDLFNKQHGIEVINNLITNPSHFSLDLLPDWCIDSLVDHWEDYPMQQEIFKSYTTGLSSFRPITKEEKNSLVGVIKKYDNYHKQDFCTAFPEFAEYYNHIKTLDF